MSLIGIILIIGLLWLLRPLFLAWLQIRRHYRAAREFQERIHRQYNSRTHAGDNAEGSQRRRPGWYPSPHQHKKRIAHEEGEYVAFTEIHIEQTTIREETTTAKPDPRTVDIHWTDL